MAAETSGTWICVQVATCLHHLFGRGPSGGGDAVCCGVATFRAAIESLPANAALSPFAGIHL